MKIMLISKKRLIISAVAAVIIITILILACSIGAKPKDKQKGLNTSVGAVDANAVGFSGKDWPTEQYELEILAGLMKELPVYSVAREDKRIALTIDAAWGDDKTDFILQTLSKYNIKATFFLCGTWVKSYPDKVKLIEQAGHEIGNHSLTHPHMSKLSAEQIIRELKRLDDLLEPLIGRRTNLFRAPFGEYNDKVIMTAREAGYQTVQWNIDTVDWKEERSAQTILDTVLSRLKAGSIILCHNNAFTIDRYLPTLIETALSQGYEFVTVSELLLNGDTVIDVNGVQKPVG